MPLNEYLLNMQTMIDRIRNVNPNCKIIIWGIVPVEDDLNRDKNIQNYDQFLRKLVDDNKCAYIDTRQLLSPHTKNDIYFDQVHINDKGQDIIIDEMMKHIM